MIANGNSASTVYNQRPWGMPAPTVDNQALGPNQSNQERIRGERMAMQLAMSAVPPQVQLFRPRFGYRVDALGIQDVLNVDILYSPPNGGTWFSGGPAEINSTSVYSNYSATFGNL
jgi:hypothetical protein